MTRMLVARLLAGIAPTALHAQEAASTAPPPAPTEAAPPQAQAPPVMEFRGPDGKPLPPEVQAELRERFKNASPAPGTGVRIGADGQRDVVVSAVRPRGAVVGDIPPERVIDPGQIRALGANSVEELIQTLGPEVASGRGRDDGGPIVLLNGKRVSNFAEIARIPTEAIERMEVLPEEVALKYGYRADQKVVNVVVFDRYSARVGQALYAAPTEGGRDTIGGTATLLRLRGDTRLNLDGEYNRSGALLERERDIRQPEGAEELGRFRTLLPASERFALGGTFGTALSDMTAAITGRFETTSTEALFGLAPDGPLRRDADTRIVRLGTTLSGRLGGWAWSVIGNYDRNRVDTLTDVPDGSGARDAARAVNTVAGADLLVSGTAFDLPAGPVSTSVRGGVDLRDFDSRSRVRGVDRAADLSRDRGMVQANIDLPIAGERAPDIAWLGRLTASANLQVERLSDFGTLATVGYGLSWSPVPALNLLASVTEEQGAPAVEQLGGPLIVTPNVRTFDFVRGETVDITRVSGGNAALRADDRRVINLGLNAKPIPRTDLTINVDYLDTRIDDPIAAFPIPTAQIEAAFPERFARDGGGRLARIDGTPLNFARSRRREIRSGVNFVRTLGSLPPGTQLSNVRYISSEAELKRRLPPGAQVTRVEPGSPSARRFENLASRLILGVQHLWRLEDEVLLRPGAPVLDLLDGGALDARGGRPRHEVEVQAGAFKRGLGARVNATWQSGTTVRGLGPDGDLDFGSLATVSLNAFADLGTYLGGPRAPRWARGLRMTLGVTNLFNQRPEVRDATGETPINYQPAYLNPLGRAINLSVRKVF